MRLISTKIGNQLFFTIMLCALESALNFSASYHMVFRIIPTIMHVCCLLIIQSAFRRGKRWIPIGFLITLVIHSGYNSIIYCLTS
jgi:hypothetical protein